MPVGGFAGPRKIMKHLSPEGGVYQAGTLSGNPVAMTAGLDDAARAAERGRLEAARDARRVPRADLTGVLAETPLPAKLVRLGSMFWIAWLTDEAAALGRGARRASAKVYARVFHSLLDQGIALAPSAFEIAFLSLAHTRRDIDRLAEACVPRYARSVAEPRSKSVPGAAELNVAPRWRTPPTPAASFTVCGRK